MCNIVHISDESHVENENENVFLNIEIRKCLV